MYRDVCWGIHHGTSSPVMWGVETQQIFGILCKSVLCGAWKHAVCVCCGVAAQEETAFLGCVAPVNVMLAAEVLTIIANA